MNFEDWWKAHKKEPYSSPKDLARAAYDQGRADYRKLIDEAIANYEKKS